MQNSLHSHVKTKAQATKQKGHKKPENLLFVSQPFLWSSCYHNRYKWHYKWVTRVWLGFGDLYNVCSHLQNMSLIRPQSVSVRTNSTIQEIVSMCSFEDPVCVDCSNSKTITTSCWRRFKVQVLLYHCLVAPEGFLSLMPWCLHSKHFFTLPETNNDYMFVPVSKSSFKNFNYMLHIPKMNVFYQTVHMTQRVEVLGLNGGPGAHFGPRAPVAVYSGHESRQLFE